MKDQYLENMGLTKVLLMLCVVIYHSIAFWTNSWGEVKPLIQSQSLSLVASWLNSFHIYSFTIASRYLFSFCYREKKDYRVLGIFLRRKSKRLLIPYILVSILWVIPFAIIVDSKSTINIFTSYVLGINPEQLWFLLMLFLCSLWGWFYRKYRTNRPYFPIIVSVMTFLIGSIGMWKVPNVFQIWNSLIFLTYYIIGIEMECNQLSIGNIKWYFLVFFVFIHLALFVLGKCLLVKESIIYTFIGYCLSYITHIAGGFTAFIGFQELSKYLNNHKSHCFLFLTKYTMRIFFFHQQIIYLFMILLNGIIPPFFHAFLAFAVSLILSLGISCLIDKASTRIRI